MRFHGKIFQDASLKKSTLILFNVLTYRYVTIYRFHEQDGNFMDGLGSSGTGGRVLAGIGPSPSPENGRDAAARSLQRGRISASLRYSQPHGLRTPYAHETLWFFKGQPRGPKRLLFRQGTSLKQHHGMHSVSLWRRNLIRSS